MAKEIISVVYDRRKTFEKFGYGYAEILIYLGRKQRKYITLAKCTPDEVPNIVSSPTTKEKMQKCRDVLSTMSVMEEEMSCAVFDIHYLGKKPKVRPNYYKGTDQTTNFINFMKDSIETEDVCEGTRKHKRTTLDAIKSFGKIRTFLDLTPKNILMFDRWLHDGTRTDVSVHTYHKHLRKVTRFLRMADMIPIDPYERVKIKRGKSKERQPLTEDELNQLRTMKLNQKLAQVRDLFIFSAYTGLAYCDVQVFDFDLMTEKSADIYYIDGQRLKTGIRFFTPILQPAMDVLKKYNFELPKISNQKGNDYLHVIQSMMGLNKNLTFHVARHSFATLALSHGVPLEDVARMLGHEDVHTTLIYAKILKNTIQQFSSVLQKSIQ